MSSVATAGGFGPIASAGPVVDGVAVAPLEAGGLATAGTEGVSAAAGATIGAGAAAGALGALLAAAGTVPLGAGGVTADVAVPDGATTVACGAVAGQAVATTMAGELAGASRAWGAAPTSPVALGVPAVEAKAPDCVGCAKGLAQGAAAHTPMCAKAKIAAH
ncbi:MAG TPA: hypothetical protein VEE84_06270, partial [Burkholderiaceae bacterium]|nr:hypothetical protein [Burkholderiaceae bacterium]